VARGSGDVGENSRSSKDLYQDEVANLTLVSSFCTLVCFSCTRISVASTLVENTLIRVGVMCVHSANSDFSCKYSSLG
jgi:hypothetical protein